LKPAMGMETLADICHLPSFFFAGTATPGENASMMLST
jgi:hypothetical protein